MRAYSDELKEMVKIQEPWVYFDYEKKQWDIKDDAPEEVKEIRKKFLEISKRQRDELY